MTTAAQLAALRHGQPRTFQHLSFSSISLFQQCPLRFAFRYVLGIPEEVAASSLVFGSAIHAGLEFYFQQLLVGSQAPTLDTLLDVFQDAWRSHDGPPIRFARGEDINGIGRLAERMFRAFLHSDMAHPNGTILAVEESLSGVLVPGCPEILGRVDLIVETDDAVEVTDFKTSRSGWSEEHVLESAPQLLLYSELARHLADGKRIRVGFGVITKTQKPTVILHPVTVHPAQVERTKKIVERVWAAIQAGHFYPNASMMNCSGCPYRRACRSWCGG